MKHRYDLIREIIAGQGPRICSVLFVKKDGTLRRMVVQYAASATHMLGEAAPEYKQRAAQTRRDMNPNLLNVWDIQKHAFRSINMDTVKEIRGEGRILWEAA